MPRGRKSTTQSSEKKEARTQTPKGDAVRVELMKRIYVARDPESTADTWLHHPDCKDEGGKDAAEKCEAAGCGSFSGLEVERRIDQGWWNSVPGDC